MSIWGRTCKVTLAVSPGVERVWYGGEPAQVGEQTLRIAFSLELDRTREPNQGEITIYNLARESRDTFKKGQVIALEAGHVRGTGSGEVFRGRVLHRDTPRREGPDILTTIQVSDGALERLESTGVVRLAAGASPAAQVQALFDKIKAPQGVVDSIRDKLKSSPGRSSTRVIFDELQGLLSPQGVEVSIQGGKLQAIRRGEAIPGPALLLSPASGRIGEPETIEGGGVRVTSILLPGLVPGRRLELEGGEIEGAFVASSIRLEGDTHGAPWYAITDAKREVRT